MQPAGNLIPRDVTLMVTIKRWMLSGLSRCMTVLRKEHMRRMKGDEGCVKAVWCHKES